MVFDVSGDVIVFLSVGMYMLVGIFDIDDLCVVMIVVIMLGVFI